jgi:L-threonylcarbamoyladenylate synthase
MMQDEIQKAIKVLKKGGSILYPTDTVWGIGCDATNSKAVSKIFKIKGRGEKKSMIILLDHADKIKDYVKDYPQQVSDLIHSYHKPLTIVFPGAKNLAKKLIAEDGSIAIRIIRHEYCNQLIKEFGKPLVSTSANISGDDTPLLFRNISEFVKEKVNYIVDYEQNKLHPSSPSTLIRIDDTGSYEVLRP